MEVIDKFVVVPKFESFEEFNAWFDQLKSTDYAPLIIETEEK